MEAISNPELPVDCTAIKEAEGQPAKRARVSIACMRCKTRKNRCDGRKPKCANCIAHHAECVYSAVRKTRGQGKNKKHIADPGLSKPPLRPLESASLDLNRGHQGLALITHSRGELTDPPLPNSGLLQINSSVRGSLVLDSIKNGSAVFPAFLLPDVYGSNLKKLRASLGGEKLGHKITPLLPLAVSRRLIQNSFAEVMAEHQLLDLQSFVTLLDAQYATSSVDHAGNPARWALVNTVIALALRVKTAPGSEAELSDIPRAYYRNATTVIPDLILQDSSLLSIQALLTMAIFSQGISDTQAFITLSSNASRQLELFGLKRLLEGRTIDRKEEQRHKQVSRVAHLLERPPLMSTVPGQC